MRTQVHHPHRLSSKKGPDGLTERQRAILEYITDHVAQKGYGPTVRGIGFRFDIKSPNGVLCHLDALCKKGLIARDPNISRGIKVLETASEQERNKLIDQIKALPITDLERIVHQFC